MKVWSEDTEEEDSRSVSMSQTGDCSGRAMGMTISITDYIRFCEDTTVPSKKVSCFQNDKPWINKDIKGLLNSKKYCEELLDVQKELKRKLRGADATRLENAIHCNENDVKIKILL